MYHITVQFAGDKSLAPKSSVLRQWAKSALHHQIESGELTIRIVDVDEMTILNSTYRQKKSPTNVLSFPFETPKNIETDLPILGDIIICSEVVNAEAKEQGKSLNAHWAHMVVHGVFHLLGYDHENDHDAEKMEALEIDVMQRLGFANPYKNSEK